MKQRTHKRHLRFYYSLQASRSSCNMVFWGHTSAQRAKKNMKKRLYIADTHTNEHPHACYNVRPNAGRLNLHNTAHVHAQSYFQTHARRCLYMHNKPMTFSRGIVERLGPLACAISHCSQAVRALPSVARAAGYHTLALHRPPLPQTTSSKFGVNPRICHHLAQDWSWRDFGILRRSVHADSTGVLCACCISLCLCPTVR